MMKKLLYLIFLLAILPISAQQITFTESSGWLESAFVKWTPLAGADTYNVYYTGGGQTNKKIDNELVRSYGSYFRADIPGLAAGNYTITVKPVSATVEGAGTTTSNLTVISQDRTGFAFDGGRIPGGYNTDGTPKTGAVILYITQNTKNTISMNITGASTNPCVGLQNILYGIKKGKDTRPFIIRLIGNITDMDVMEGGDITIENANNASSYLTIEGVGSDAVINGMGIRLKSASNIEVSNLGFMNCNSTAGDNVGLQDKNDHVWVHNCDLFYGDAGSDADQIKGDGAMDNKGSTYVTFSYNHFWDSGKSSLLGLSEGTTTGLYLTYHHNWFDHSDSRHPRVRFYSAHIYNNYYDGVSKYGAGSTFGSSLFVEGNYYRNSKHPMLTSLQGTDVWDEAGQKNNPGTMGTFSNEPGGTIKAFNNTFDADIATNNMRFVAYGDTNPLFNIVGKINSTTDFDAYVVSNREDQVPATVKSFSGANVYNNFDTNASFYVKNLVVEQPAIAKNKVIQYAGRISGGDLKWTFNNTVDDASSTVIAALKSALTNYSSKMVAVQGEIPVVASTQTLSTDTDNNQTVSADTAIQPMIFTWGGDATDATVTGLPSSGVSFVKDTAAKTITISGIPTASISYSIKTSGTGGTPANATGTITLEGTATPPPGDQIHNFTLSDKVNAFYTITGNLATNKGTVTYNELTLTQCLKMETATTITYTTTLKSTLTLVFVEATGTAKIDGTNYTATAGIITISLEPGNHTIAKKDTANLFYVKTVYTSTLGLDQKFETSKLTLYPNPVANQIFISSENVQKVEIYNLLGTLVKTIEKNTQTIDVSNLPSGNYIVKITTDQGMVTKKIVKK